MSTFSLSEKEQQHFGELFASLDQEKEKKLDLRRTSEFLSKCDLPMDQFEQILEVCGANRLGHFGRSQFYIALKLIALAQNAYELSSENLSKQDIPLPIIYSERSDASRHLHSIKSDNNSFVQNSNTTTTTAAAKKSGYLPPPPSSSNKTVRHRIGHHMQRLSLDSSLNTTSGSDFAEIHSLASTGISSSTQNQISSSLETNGGAYVQLMPSKDPTPSAPVAAEEESIYSECSSPEFVNVVDCEQTPGSLFAPLKPWQELENRNQQLRNQEQAIFLNVEDEAHHHLLSNEEDDLTLQGLCALNVPEAASYRCFTNEDEEEDDEEQNAGKNSNVVKDDHQKTNGICNGATGSTNKLLDSHDGFSLTDQDKFSSLKIASPFESCVDEEDNDVWSISDNQLRYFHSKFVELNSGSGDRLAGSEVRPFLEKSKLPLVDLKRIWQLSDLDQDGQLTLIEFCIAVQLIVLRRNDVELPDTLPRSLHPERWAYRLPRLGLRINVSVEPSEVAVLDQTLSPAASKEWTKFSDSPEPHTSTSSTKDCSPVVAGTTECNGTMKPVSFDHIELDPRIPHPIAVKANQITTKPQHNWNAQTVNPSKNALISPDAIANYQIPPPPRPVRVSGHGRSSSLDLNRKVIDFNFLNSDHQSAFTNYRKHVQQLHLQQLQRKAKCQSLNKYDYISLLRTKYQVLPATSAPVADLNEQSREQLIDLNRSMQERMHLVEMMNELLINELASLLAEKSPLSAAVTVASSSTNSTNMSTTANPLNVCSNLR